MQFVKKTLLEKRFRINNYNLIVKYEEYVLLITNTFLYYFRLKSHLSFFLRKNVLKMVSRNVSVPSKSGNKRSRLLIHSTRMKMV